MEKSLLIAGYGGQGILFMGKLIAYTAMLEGKKVTWFPSYGAEMRGGTANCTVVISDESIGSPVVQSPEILIIFNDASLKRFLPRLKKIGTLFYDSSLLILDSDPHSTCIGIEASRIASELGNTRSANMVMLGAVASITGLLEKSDIILALEDNTPQYRSNSIPLNRKALIKGFELKHSLLLETKEH